MSSLDKPSIWDTMGDYKGVGEQQVACAAQVALSRVQSSLEDALIRGYTPQQCEPSIELCSELRQLKHKIQTSRETGSFDRFITQKELALAINVTDMQIRKSLRVMAVDGTDADRLYFTKIWDVSFVRLMDKFDQWEIQRTSVDPGTLEHGAVSRKLTDLTVSEQERGRADNSLREFVRTDRACLRTLWGPSLMNMVRREYEKTGADTLPPGNESPGWTDERKGLSKLNQLLLDRANGMSSVIRPSAAESRDGQEVKNLFHERYTAKTSQLRDMVSLIPNEHILAGLYSYGDVPKEKIVEVLDACMTLDDQVVWLEKMADHVLSGELSRAVLTQKVEGDRFLVDRLISDLAEEAFRSSEVKHSLWTFRTKLQALAVIMDERLSG